MTRYNVFDGGDKLRHPTEFESGVVKVPHIRPAAHHTERAYFITKHLDTGSRPFTKHANPLVVRSGDELVTHVGGAGWTIKGLGIHVKVPTRGKFTFALELSDGTKVDFAPYDSETPTDVDLSKTGFTVLRPVNPNNPAVREVLETTGNCFVVAKFTGLNEDGSENAEEILSGCYGITLEAVYWEDERSCNCVRLPCPTTFPDPNCEPKVW